MSKPCPREPSILSCSDSCESCRRFSGMHEVNFIDYTAHNYMVNSGPAVNRRRSNMMIGED